MPPFIPKAEDLTINKYQELSKETAVFPEINSKLSDTTLDFLIAAGKLAGIVKKIFRDSDGKMSPASQAKLQAVLDEAFDHLTELEFVVASDIQESGEFPIPSVAYPILGLFDEVAELAEKCQQNDLEGAAKELGDVNWYSPQIGSGLKFEMGEVMRANLVKLFDRKSRGVLKGSGDNR